MVIFWIHFEVVLAKLAYQLDMGRGIKVHSTIFHESLGGKNVMKMGKTRKSRFEE